METEQEQEKVITMDQLRDFINSLDKQWKEALEMPVLTHYDYKILYWFKHKLLKFANGESFDSRTLTSTDKNIIDFLHHYKFSIGDIAFAVNRSKSTVHEYLRRSGKTEQNP
jgi:hypothetical protein